MMKKVKSLYTTAIVLAALAAAPNVFAQAPKTVSYQGYLTDASGVVMNGSHTMTLKLYDSPNGGAPLWTETQSVTLNQGLFNVMMGGISQLNINFDRQYWLAVSVDGGPEMNPRTALATVPYSMRSAWADSASSVQLGSISGIHIANGSITLDKLSAGGSTAGQVLTSTGSGFAWQNITGTGGSTTINGASGAVELLGTGGATVTRSGNQITINTDRPIESVNSVDHAIWVKDGTGPAVTLALVPGSIGTSYLTNGAVTADKLANGAITWDKLGTGAVTSLSLADGAITTDKLAVSAVSAAQIADGSLTGAEFNTTGASAGQALTFDGSAVVWGNPTPAGAAGGDLTGSYPNPTIINNAVTSEKILDGTIMTADIANNAVTVEKLAAGNAISGQTLIYNGTDLTWGNPTAARLILPYEDSVAAEVTAFAVANTGSGGAGSFTIRNESSNGTALFAGTNGTGQAAHFLGNTRVQDGNVLFDVAPGADNLGSAPASGAGSRLMWVAGKSAFRSGSVEGSQWDFENIGINSAAFGLNTRASGPQSAAFGCNTLASGSCSFAAGSVTESRGFGSFAAGDSSLTSGDFAATFGSNNLSSGHSSFTGGHLLIASGTYAVAMGFCNQANGINSTALGFNGRANGNFSTTIGFQSIASGDMSMGIGRFTLASGHYSTAMGNFSSTNGHNGAFVIGDNSTENYVNATADNQFVVRASGGVIFYSNSTLTSGVQLAAGDGAWQTVSDRNKKENFRTEDGEKVLGAIATMPITSWNYKSQNTSIRHLGPMAQDFHAAFGLGVSDTTISTIDIDGVNMLAIQALEKRTAQLKAKITEIETLRAGYDALSKQNQELVAQIATLKTMVESIASEHTSVGNRQMGALETK